MAHTQIQREKDRKREKERERDSQQKLGLECRRLELDRWSVAQFPLCLLYPPPHGSYIDPRETLKKEKNKRESFNS